jgi:hypothetical protein
MDINQYQKDRAADFKKFQLEYGDLKLQYSQLLTQAAYESDPGKQAELVKLITMVNSNLAQHVREFIQSAQGKFDPVVISKLTNDIIQYQKEIQALKISADKTETLRGILNRDKTQLSEIQEQFNVYLGILLAGIAVVLILLFRTTIKQWSQAAESLMSSTSSFESEQLPDLPDEQLYKISPV